MERRRALAVLAGVAAWRPARAARATGPPRVLAWGGGRFWVGHDGEDRLVGASTESLASVDPVAHARGVVAVDASGRLRAWQHDGTGWHESWSLGFDAAVHALCASDDGAWVLAAHGHSLSLVDRSGRVQRRYAGRDALGRRQGAASVLRHHAGRRSFVAAWPTLGELWEIPLDPAAPPVFEGLVHDYRMGEAIATPGQFAVRRVPLGAAVPSLDFCDARVPWVAGMAEGLPAVVHLDVRRRIAGWPLPDARPAGAALVREGASWQWWLPVAETVQVIDASRWQSRLLHALPGRVFTVFVLGAVPWVWVDHAVPLHAWRQGSWQAVAGAPAAVSAIAVDASGEALWCADAASQQVVRLDGAGRTLQRWPLPAGAVLRGLAAFPP